MWRTRVARWKIPVGRYFPVLLFRYRASSRSAPARAHISRMNHEAKGINRGTHCKISDSFRIEIMAAAYSRMRIPRVKRASCEMSDLRPFPSRLSSRLNVDTKYTNIYSRQRDVRKNCNGINIRKRERERVCGSTETISTRCQRRYVRQMN